MKYWTFFRYAGLLPKSALLEIETFTRDKFNELGEVPFMLEYKLNTFIPASSNKLTSCLTIRHQSNGGCSLTDQTIELTEQELEKVLLIINRFPYLLEDIRDKENETDALVRQHQKAEMSN